jgi:hypothetical protein
MRTIGWMAGVGSLIASFAFMVVSLNRWEWNRALFFGLIFLIAEIALATGLVLRRLSLLARATPDDEVLAAIRAARPPNRDRFAWTKRMSRDLNVFITFLVGAGAIASAGAWMIDRVAGRTSVEHAERRLARKLAPISYPRVGFVIDDLTAMLQGVPGEDDADVRALLRHVGHGE